MRVADSIDARLLLDTGAGINTLAAPILDRLGREARSAGTHTGTRHNGKQITGAIWSVPSMSLGPLTKRDVVVGNFAPPNADGMLSMDYFRDVWVQHADAAAGVHEAARHRTRHEGAWCARVPGSRSTFPGGACSRGDVPPAGEMRTPRDRDAILPRRV